MHDIQRIVDPSSGTTIYHLSGAITLDHLLEMVETYYADRPTPNIIYDFCDATTELHLGRDIRKIIDIVRRLRENRPAGKTALVFSDPKYAVLGKLYAGFARSAGLPYQISIFKTQQDAILWIGT